MEILKKNGVLNSEIAKILADLGHTDIIIIGDAGLPVPSETKKIDLALVLGMPTFIEVLDILIDEMIIEKYYLAEEIKEQNPKQLIEVKKRFSETVPSEFISHDELKLWGKKAKAIIRTGEVTPYSNIILQSGVIF